MSPLDTSASSSVPPTTTQPELTSGKTGSGKPSTSSGSKPKPSSGGTGEQKPSTKPGSPTKPGGTSGSTTSKPPATTGSSPPTTAGGQPTPTPTPTPTPPRPFKWGANSGSNTATTTSPGGSSGSGGWHPSSPWNNGGVSNASSGGRPDRYRPDADWWSRPRYNGGAASSNSASNAPGRTSTPNSTASRTTTTVQNRPPVNSAPPALSSSQPPIPASGDSRFVDSVNPAGVTGGTDAFGPRGLDPNRGADSAFDELGQQMFGKDFESRVGAAATTGAITTMTQGGSPRDIAVSAATDAAVKATVEVGKEVLLETGLKDTWNNVTRSLGAGGDSDTSWNINVDFEKGKVKDVMFNISAPLK